LKAAEEKYSAIMEESDGEIRYHTERKNRAQAALEAVRNSVASLKQADRSRVELEEWETKRNKRSSSTSASSASKRRKK